MQTDPRSLTAKEEPREATGTNVMKTRFYLYPSLKGNRQIYKHEGFYTPKPTSKCVDLAHGGCLYHRTDRCEEAVAGRTISSSSSSQNLPFGPFI